MGEKCSVITVEIVKDKEFWPFLGEKRGKEWKTVDGKGR
jgi:hypothetical protein